MKNWGQNKPDRCRIIGITWDILGKPEPMFSLGLPWWLRGKNLPANAGGAGWIPGSGRSLEIGKSNQFQYSGKSNGQRSLAGYSPWVPKTGTQFSNLTTKVFSLITARQICLMCVCNSRASWGPPCILGSFLNFFWLCWAAYRILIPQLGIKPVPPAVEAQILTTGPRKKSLSSVLNTYLLDKLLQNSLFAWLRLSLY